MNEEYQTKATINERLENSELFLIFKRETTFTALAGKPDKIIE